MAIWRWLLSPVVFPDFGVAMFARTICFIIIPRLLESESGGAAIGKVLPSGAAPGPPDPVLWRNLSTRLRLSDDADVRLNGFYTSLLDKGQALVSSVVEAIIAEVSSCVVSLIIIFLYVIFGLLYPLPIGGKVSNLVRSYLWKKTVVSLLYGFSVSALFLLLNNDLAVFFGIVSFFFNYVPEVGTIIAIFIPMPVILLDGRLLSPAATLAKATVGQLVLKIVFNNIIETSLIQNDQEMRIHPVWVLLTINYFGFIWGPAGMMIGVPILSVMKGAAVSAVELTESKDDVAK
ncbi:tqsA, partial [Symbiodinium necroappetens]